MKKDHDLLMLLFIVIMLAILTIYCFTLNEVHEIKNILEISKGTKPFDEFRYLKDFTDRNVKVYGIVTTVVVSMSVFGAGLFFKIMYEDRITSLRSLVDANLKQTANINKNHIRENQKTLQEINLNTANSFAAIADVLRNNPEQIDLEHSIYIRTYAIYHYLKSIEHLSDKESKTSEWKSVPEQLSNLVEDLKNIETIESLKIPDDIKTYLMNNVTGNFSTKIAEIITLTNQKSTSA